MTLRIDGTSNEVLLTVIVPIFNEEHTLDELLQRVLTVPIDKELIIVNDASTDGTSSVLIRWAKRPNVRVITHQSNRGKGAAIRSGLAFAIGKYTIIQDGDLEYFPEDYQTLLEPLVRSDAEVVYGSRYLDNPDCDRHAQRGMFRYGVSLLNLAVHLLYGAKLTDEATCYKVFPTALLRSLDLQCERFEFCPEVTAKICRLGIKILELPIRYSPRNKSQGKKIRLRDGIEALQSLWLWRRWQPEPKRVLKTRQATISRKSPEKYVIP